MSDTRREIADQRRIIDGYGVWTRQVVESAMSDYAAAVLEDGAGAFKEAGETLGASTVTVEEVVRVLRARAAQERAR